MTAFLTYISTEQPKIRQLWMHLYDFAANAYIWAAFGSYFVPFLIDFLSFDLFPEGYSELLPLPH
jgi:hypothetical protein